MKIKMVLLLVLFSLSIQAADEDRLLVLTEEWKPFSFEENGKISGVSTAMVKAILDHANLQYEIDLLPWKRAYRIANNKKNTILFSVSRIASRESDFIWVGPLFLENTSFYRLTEREDIQINDAADLTRYTIGVSRGGSAEAYLNKNGFKENQNYYSYESDQQAEKMLVSDRVDLIPISDMRYLYRRNVGNSTLPKVAKAFTYQSESFYVGINKGTSEKVVKRITESFKQLSQKNFQEKIINNFFLKIKKKGREAH
ncbi:substrate-binding periplasmic protein [Aliikangiella coralliicola]|uniref:ABC transporter substrate-binding protein n=1 Tax=Aliikangiella coralliicola TaxID=2592383 RepID=A0A545U8W9_9GAMM|nr:ABC transporter substrate-binding protein [Aliikangiella coralliicola]TQV85914.1 ABC transporter substrate-binding protein [Aliikangiella coralliicola]